MTRQVAAADINRQVQKYLAVKGAPIVFKTVKELTDLYGCCTKAQAPVLVPKANRAYAGWPCDDNSKLNGKYKAFKDGVKTGGVTAQGFADLLAFLKGNPVLVLIGENAFSLVGWGWWIPVLDLFVWSCSTISAARKSFSPPSYSLALN